MKKILAVTGFMLATMALWAQTDFSFGTKHKNGITSVYYTFSGSYSYEYKTQYRYGLYDENAKKLILPIKYKTIWNSNEEGIFIVEDTLKRWGIYSVKSNSFILNNEYSEIKTFSDGLSTVSKMNADGLLLYGAVDKTGKIIIPIQYKFLGTASEGFICFSKDKGYGFIDKNNKEVIPAIYRSASVFKSGLACMSLLDSTNYGYIDKNNKWIIPPKFLRGNDFKDNFAVVFTTRNYSLNSDNAGVIDKTGKEIVPLKYDYITVEDNFFVVKEIKKETYITVTRYGMIDFNGNVILPIEYSAINKKYGTDFYEASKGLKYSLVDKNAKIVTKEEYDYINTFTDFGLSYLKKDNKYTVIDKSLKIIIPEHGATNVIFGRKNKLALLFKDKMEIYNETGKLLKTIQQDNISTYGTDFFSNDDSLKISFNKSAYLFDIATQKKQLLPYNEVNDFNEEGIFIGKTYSSYDFVDYTGKKLNTKTYYTVVNFSDGIAAVQESMYSTPYLVDKNFTKIKDLYNVFEGPFSEGLAKAKASYGSTRYYYDKNGNSFSISNAIEAGEFKNGRAYIKESYPSKYYFIDKTGKKINAEKYDEVGNFSESVAGVKIDNKVGFIDTTGKTVIPFKFDVASPFYNGTAIVKDANEYYLINKKGEKIGRDVYNGAGNPSNGTYPVQKGTVYGLIDEKGKVLIDFKYQEVIPESEGITWAKKEGKWGLVSTGSDKAITKFEYDSGDKCKNGYIKAGKDKKLGLLDKTGKQVLPVIYDQMGSVYKGKVLLVLNDGKKVIALK